MSIYRGKRVLIVGFGLSGASAARYMVNQGAKVVVTDLKQRNELMESVKKTEDLRLELDLGRHTPKYFQGAEVIVVSPGIPADLPLLAEARARGCVITSEMEIALSHIKTPIVAITGTNGKTTTTALIGEMFKADQKAVFVGGNIGLPLLEYVNQNSKATVCVVEVSSFQLDLLKKMPVTVGVMTNLDQDHLDRYPNMDVYTASKRKLMEFCGEDSVMVLNYDDEHVRKFSDDAKCRVHWFTKFNPMHLGGTFSEGFAGAYLIGEGPTAEVVLKSVRSVEKRRASGREEVFSLAKFRLFGGHNRENLMAAIVAARAMDVSPQAIQKVIEEFKGVEHRLEFIRKKDGVFFFNDSKATNVNSLQRSLMAFKKNPVILISGGKDKNMDFTPLADLVQKRVKILIILGEAKEKINRAIGDLAETYLVGTFEEAVLLAYQKSRSGDIILLSPGCASYDMFRNFEERGEYFKKLVAQL